MKKNYKIHNKSQYPKAIDLFSGCGGLTLGLKQAGIRVVGAVEIDSLAVETYKTNHKETYVWHRDIKKLSVVEVMKKFRFKRGELDLLAGCPPCQGFSRMTTLNGKKRMVDSRNDLVFEFIRFVRVLRPKAIMMENVPGLARNRRFKQVRKVLTSLGYKYDYSILDAADYGVPQRRKRLILLASQGKLIPFARPARYRRTVREVLGQLNERTRRGPLHTLKERRKKETATLISMIPKNGGSRLDLGEDKQLKCHRKCNGFKDVYGRMSWDDVSPTITSGCVNPSKGRFLHPTLNRTITLREAALLQSFPPNYFLSLRRGKMLAAEMIGNALPPEFIRRHALQVKKVLIASSGTDEPILSNCRKSC